LLSAAYVHAGPIDCMGPFCFSRGRITAPQCDHRDSLWMLNTLLAMHCVQYYAAPCPEVPLSPAVALLCAPSLHLPLPPSSSFPLLCPFPPSLPGGLCPPSSGSCDAGCTRRCLRLAIDPFYGAPRPALSERHTRHISLVRTLPLLNRLRHAPETRSLPLAQLGPDSVHLYVRQNVNPPASACAAHCNTRIAVCSVATSEGRASVSIGNVSPLGISTFAGPRGLHTACEFWTPGWATIYVPPPLYGPFLELMSSI
jgi:hypothetical protein